MMRRPACSIIALIAPVRLRAVASGLRMENVRSTAIDDLPHVPLLRDAAAYSGRPTWRQSDCNGVMMPGIRQRAIFVHADRDTTGACSDCRIRRQAKKKIAELLR
jgi:hypothetical protein